MFGLVSKSGHRPDYFLIALIVALTIFGLAMLSSASSEIGKIKFNDSYYYLKHQIYNGLIVGIIGLLIASRVNYQNWKKIALIALIVSLILLALVFTKFGVHLGGSTRWVNLGPITFQPAELLKITYVLYLAAWLSNQKNRREKSFWSGFIPFLITSGLIAVLLLLQPATSMVAILLGTAIVVYFLSDAKIKFLLAIGALAVVAVGLLIIFTPYRLNRITTLLNPKSDELGLGYHQNEARTAIGSGGLFGLGYGGSRTKTNLLPAPADDSIFAVTGEELGFVGAGSLVAIFGILVVRLFWIGKNIRDQFGKLLIYGFATIIAAQSIINIGAISGVFPLTGVPLPFISYGGTALIVFLTMSGIAINISKYTRR